MENVTIESRVLGKSGVIVPAMGVGTMLWTPNKSFSEEDIMKTFSACLDNGLNFFDTAEIYRGSEKIIAKCKKRDNRPVILASKFMPPSSMNPLKQKRTTVSADSPRALLEALDKSLLRLEVDYLDLYQMHSPSTKNTIAEYMDVMAEAVKAGKVRAVGVCNFSSEQMREAHVSLTKHNISLATAMVGYNLLRRWPETNGVLDTCKELGVSVIPYAPLAEGVLTGKYRGKKRVPLGYTVATYFGHLNFTKERDDSSSFIKRLFTKPLEISKKKIEPLFKVMDKIASEHGKTLAQIAINWLLTNDDVCIIPIPGMKNVRQVNDNVGTLGWSLTKEERILINKTELETRK